MCINALRAFVLAASGLASLSPVMAADWPMLGRTPSRNPVSPEMGAPIDWNPGEFDGNTGERTGKGARNVKWIAKLGSSAYGAPSVADGQIYVGTNNMAGYVERYPNTVDLGCLLCLRESDGQFLWQYSAEKHPVGRVYDWAYQGIGSSPLVEGERMWFVNNRWEVVCADTQGFRDGENDGPFVDEPFDDVHEADVLWTFDMIGQLGVSPHTAGMGPDRRCSIAAYENRIYVVTGNGVDIDHKTIPAPNAPSLVCLDKDTGEVLWTDNSPSANILHTQIASPLVAEIAGRVQVIVPQGDGWVRSFDALSGELIWKFDINFKDSRWLVSSQFTRNNILATPVLYENRVYIASGEDAESYTGMGRLVCIDPTKSGDISSELAVDVDGNVIPHRRLQAVDPAKGEKAIANPNSGLIWDFGAKTFEDYDQQEFEEQMHRTRSSVAVDEGLVIVADGAGLVHCFDATSGKRHWAFDLFSECIPGPLIVDRKVYVADENGDVAIFRLSHDPNVAMKRVADEYEPIAEIYMDTSIACSPVFANGVLYLATRSHLFAIQETDQQDEQPTTAMGEWKQWRGPDRANKSPDTGLLGEWPQGGPPLDWKVEGLGQGVASVSIEAGRIYTTTYANDAEYVVALDQAAGRLVWTTQVGPSIRESSLMRLLSQRTPTLDGERLYALTAKGDLVCLRTTDGKEVWRKNYVDDFHGQPGWWYYCDFPLVDGDKLICTPLGRENTMVALNKFTGEMIWSSSVPPQERVRSPGTYAATVAIDAGGTRQYVNFLQGRLTSIAADDGELLCQYDGFTFASSDPQFSLTPIVNDDLLFVVGGRGAEIALSQVTRNKQGATVREVYRRGARFNHFQDNLVAVDGNVFASQRRGGLICYAMQSGEELWSAEVPRQRGMGNFVAMTYADGRLYVRHADGSVALVEPSPDEYIEKGRLQLPEPRTGMGATAPVIAGGHLFVRDDDRLYCYDVRQEALDAERPEPTTVTVGFPSKQRVNRGFARGAPRRGARGAARPGPRSVFVPTPQDVVEKMLESAKVTKDDAVYDLGSGDGRIVITAAKKYCSRAVGIEIDAELVSISRAKAKEAGVGELVTIEQQDIFETDLSDADVVAVYLLPTQLEKLIGRLEQLPPGARIVSHQFEIPGIKADRTERITSDEDGAEHAIYLWTAPIRK